MENQPMASQTPTEALATRFGTVSGERGLVGASFAVHPLFPWVRTTVMGSSARIAVADRGRFLFLPVGGAVHSHRLDAVVSLTVGTRFRVGVLLYGVGAVVLAFWLYGQAASWGAFATAARVSATLCLYSAVVHSLTTFVRTEFEVVDVSGIRTWQSAAAFERRRLDRLSRQLYDLAFQERPRRTGPDQGAPAPSVDPRTSNGMPPGAPPRPRGAPEQGGPGPSGPPGHGGPRPHGAPTPRPPREAPPSVRGHPPRSNAPSPLVKTPPRTPPS